MNIGKSYLELNLLTGEKKIVLDNMNQGLETVLCAAPDVYHFNPSGIVLKHSSGQPKDIPFIMESFERKLAAKIQHHKEIQRNKITFEPVKEKLTVGMNFTHIDCLNASARLKVDLRMKEGLPSLIVTSDGICEISATGIVTRIHVTTDPTERSEIITRITNSSGNNKNMPSVPEGQYYMYSHVLERVRDRFPHTKTWGIAAMTRYTIKQFCDSKIYFFTTNGERYVMKGKLAFVVNVKGVIVTVIPTTKDFLLYAECFKESGERIPSWLLSKTAMVRREDIIIQFSRTGF